MTLNNQEMLEALQALHAEYHGKITAINSGLNLATQRVGDARRIYYVDQANGDDANDGLETTALKTIGEAARRSVWGGVLRVNLKSDYNMDAPVAFRGGDVEIISDTLNVKRNITFAENVDPVGIASPRFYNQSTLSAFLFKDITLHSRVMTANVFAPHMIANNGFTATTFESCHFAAAPGDNLSVFKVRNGFGFYLDPSCTFSADMPGLWVNGINAGTLPSAVPMLTHSNLASL